MSADLGRDSSGARTSAGLGRDSSGARTSAYEWLQPTDAERVEWDVDVLYGPWPQHHRDEGLDDVRERLRRSPIQRALALSTRGALFDSAQGNAQTLREVAGRPELLPVGTVDLRDALSAEAQLDALQEAGVRFLRLFTVQQGGVEPGFPGYRHVVALALERGLVLLQDGDPRRFGPALAGRGARVVFLDLHAYLLADFLLLARDEPGFLCTTRMLSAPDSVERVVDTVGAGRLVFGSRTPFMDISPQTLRLRYARISDADRKAIAGGNVEELLG